MSTPSAGNSGPATQLLSEMELVRSVLADDYEILEELGRGGMAIVFRAREKALDREVAIKVLPARLAIDEGFIERFEHEARTAAKLEHPNIVPIFRVGRAGPNGEVSYFVMKLLRGQSLSAVIRDRGKLGPADVRRILTETGSALGYAAKRGVVHRDIKPDNIMLDNEGRCVVTDFGIAKAPGGQQTAAGTSLGTPRYMSPEHAMGLPLDGRSDMYSLGIVAYQCLVGNPPFSADEPFAVLYKHIHDPLPEPTLVTDEERGLFAVISKMLAKRPDDRYQTGNELIAALGGHISDPSLAAAIVTSGGLMAPTEVIPTPKAWSRQRWMLFTRAEKRLTVLLAIVSAIAIGSFMYDPQVAGTTGAAGPSAAGAGAQTTKPDSLGGPAGITATPVSTGPSPRALAIIAYNKTKSNCPKMRDTLATTKPIPYAVLLDTIPDRKAAESMTFTYDVCGLAEGSVFSAKFTLNKLRQRLRKQKPLELTAPGTADSPRSRERVTLKTGEMSSGSYRLDVTVTNGKSRQVNAASHEFRINDKE
ncbi:MAG: serine/threonine-protein kinase [Gemmatimonadaceae bacterium]